MKRTSVFLVLLTCCTFVMGQPDGKIFTATEFVWCGLDYSKVKCIGAESFNDPDAIKEKYFVGWNDLVLLESDKYDIKGAYQKQSQINDLSVVSERNKMPEAADLVIEGSYSLSEKDIEEIIASYDLKTVKEGLGVVYIMESLIRSIETARMYVVFFDIGSKKILWSSKYSARATGFGFRNYWARSIYNTIGKSKKEYSNAFKDYKKAQKKLMKKRG